MRRIVILAGAAALFAAMATPAQAALTESLSANLSPAKAGTKLRPAKGNITLDASIADTGGAGVRLPVTDRLLIELDRNVVLNGKYFPSCTAAQLDRAGTANVAACRGARVGAAVASAQVFSQGQLSGTINFSVTLFNGPRGRQLIAYVEVPGTSVKKAMIGTITRSRSPYGVFISLVIPPELKQPLPGVFPSLNRFRMTKLSATTATAKRIRVGSRTVTRKVGYVETTGCTGGSFKYRVAFDFTPPAPNVSQTATSACRR